MCLCVCVVGALSRGWRVACLQEYQPLLTLFGSTATNWADYISWYNSISFHNAGNSSTVSAAVDTATNALQNCVVGDLDDLPGTEVQLRCVVGVVCGEWEWVCPHAPARVGWL